MMYLDLDELHAVFALSPLWGRQRFALAKFKRRDFLGAGESDLKTAVLNCVTQALGKTPKGPVRMLANLRYFGYSVNPLTTYYCFDETGERVEAIVAEVNNTPWNERHAYVLPANGVDHFHFTFDKEFHVSPFNPLAMTYHWFSNTPGDHLAIHLENWGQGNKIMDATLSLRSSPITAKKMNHLLIAYPFMTVKVIAAIYWQAVKLLLKRTPFYSHSTI